MDVTGAILAPITKGRDDMKPTTLLTWTVIGLSIALAQPALAQDPGDSGRESASEERDDSGSLGGRDDGGSWPPARPTGEDARDNDGSSAGAIPAAAPRRVGTRNTTTAGDPISEDEMELTCGAGGWLETWLEDANGNPIPGTYEYYCLDE